MQCSQKICSWVKSTNVQLMAALGCAYISAPWITVEWVSFFYTLSMALKDILMIVLPILIYFYVAAALTSFKKAAPLLVLGVFLCVIASNALAVLTAYGVGNLALDGLCHKQMIPMTGNQNDIQLLFHFPIKSFIKNEWALIGGILTGILYALLPESLMSASTKQSLKCFIQTGRTKATVVLRKGFIPILPLYVLGFAMKMIHSGALNMLIGSYFKVFIVGIVLIFCYIFAMYLLATGGHVSKAFKAIQNMMPAWLTGFSTMSSAVAMPLTIM
ncbi:MAG: cation:dicarboxylase symporter family transporter, partial [Alphaproteobacteria bacterium]|nr:cation:dicarboxylase symporter family transporter [Alphaproteobacteria bacterium]